MHMDASFAGKVQLWLIGAVAGITKKLLAVSIIYLALQADNRKPAALVSGCEKIATPCFVWGVGDFET